MVTSKDYLYLFLCCQSDDAGTDSDASDAVVSLHCSESGEHRLINQVDEASSMYSDLQRLISSLRRTILQAISCYDLKLYVACFRIKLLFFPAVLNYVITF